MSVEVKVPPVGDSISEVTIGEWRKKVGDAVALDENVVEIESEKATFDVPATAKGVITQILKQPGDVAAVGETIALIDESAVPTTTNGTPSAPPAASPPPAAAPAHSHVMPAAARALHEAGLQASQVEATGPGGRLLKEDVQRQTATKPAAPAPAPAPAVESRPAPTTVLAKSAGV